MENSNVNSNLFGHILDLKRKFKSKYGCKFEESFESCIFSINQLVKRIEISFSDLEVITNDITSEKYSWRLMYGDCAVTQDLKKNLFATKFSLWIDDVFYDEIQINLQRTNFKSDVWSTIGIATIPTIDLCSRNRKVLEFYDIDCNGKLVCRMKVRGLIQVDEYCNCKVNHKKRKDGPLHQLVVSLLNRIYSKEENLNEVVPDILSLMAKIHQNDENQILTCIRLHPGFNHEVCNTYDLFLDTKDSIPRNPVRSGVSAWFVASLFPNILSILTLFLVILNDGFDVHMTYDYYNWDSILDTFQNQKMALKFVNETSNISSIDINCFLSCAAHNCNQSTSIITEPFQKDCYLESYLVYCRSEDKIRQLKVQNVSYTSNNGNYYSCSLNISSSKDINENKTATVSEIITCSRLPETPCTTMDCRIRALNPKLAFIYAATLLIFVRIFNLFGAILILWCYKGSDRIGISNVIAFYLGSCCLRHFLEKKRNLKEKVLSKAHLTIVVIIVGLLMPFATKLFLIITDARVFELETSCLERYEYRIFKSRCKKCESCNFDQCVCIFCGYSTEDSITGYQNQLNLCRMRARRSNTTTRCTMAGFQDTFMCLLQLYLALPLIKQHYNYDTSIDLNGCMEAKKGTLAVSLFSIATSVLSLSRNLTMTYFEISCKGYLAKAITARCVYFVYVAIMVLARLLTIELLGLTYFIGPSYLEYGPFALSCLVVSHVIILFIIGIIQHCKFVKTKETDTRPGKLSFSKFPVVKKLFYFQVSFTEPLNPEYNQERSSFYRNIQIVMFNLHTSIMSIFTLIRTRSFRTLGGKERLIKMSGEVKDKMNFNDRIYFNLILFAEQYVMFYLIHGATEDDRFERNLLYHCIILFHVGVLIKIFFTLKFDPWALFIPWFHGNSQNFLYKHKKKSISLIWSIITCILIGDFFYFIPQSILVLCTVIFTVGPLLFLILMSA